jgi:alginate O-acetyltransferase complex protein AlgI
VVSIMSNVGVLAIFKYYNFFVTNIDELLHMLGIQTRHIPLLKWILPIGLSFHTFQAMSYTIEVYRGHQKAERHFGIYALYVMFYPQLVAGPIERPQNMLHQFHEEKHFNTADVTSGLRLMMWGLMQKMLIADRIAPITEDVFRHPERYSSFSVLLGAFLFAFQIFCDFAGYSDIALGSARVMGFKLMVNFNRPFVSRNVTDFWRRWHISLSTWFNDYLFGPIAVSLRTWGKWAIVMAAFITFFISGLWHGAAWTFIAFGVFHGIILIYEFLTRKSRKKLGQKLPSWAWDKLTWLCTFCCLIFAWVFFRAPDMHTAWYIVSRLPAGLEQTLSLALPRNWNAAHMSDLLGPLGAQSGDIVLSLVLILLLESGHYFQSKNDVGAFLAKRPAYLRWAIYYIGVVLILWLKVDNNQAFIYFQF